ncbi:MAG: hypothetical protein QY323_03730 [Patescibacteria group bacterium]|nr:MAG: hypothetical protein QY323_03730 [Patescibacteria group bacterium]
MNNDVVVFPRDFAPAHALQNPETLIACGDAVSAGSVSGDTIEVDVGSRPLRLVLRGFKIMDPPRPARSNGSNALYLASGKDKRDGLLLQYLPPHATTSLHFHACTRETFHLLAGQAALRTPWGTEVPLNVRRSVTNDEFVPHQVVTAESASVILLEMALPSESTGMKDHFYVDANTALDIHSKGAYPSSELSNFAAHGFSIDGVDCASMEGFLQSLKEPDPEVQRMICKLVGGEAKRRGEKLNLARLPSDPLHWQGQVIDRRSQSYQQLLDRAYAELAKSGSFQKALAATGEALLVHSIGKKLPEDTILTETELCSRLLRIRYSLQS